MSDDFLQQSVLDLYEDGLCGTVVTRMDGTIVRVNKTLLAWTGYASGDLVDRRRFQDLLTVPGKIFYENQFFPLLRMQGSVKEVAFDLSRPAREPLPVLVNSVLRTDEDGQPMLIASAVFDATDRRAYEQELLRSRRQAEQLAAVVRTSSDAIVSMSSEGVIETWNEGAERMFGYGAPEIIGTALFAILEPSAEESSSGGGEPWHEMMAELRAGRPVQQDMVGRGASDRRVDVSAGFTPHLGPLGDLESVSVIMRDIGQRRAIERLQQEFLAMATHELRSPVTGIKGNAQLMQRRGIYSDRSVDVIIAQADKLQRLIEDLLLASQIQADRFTVDLRETDLVAISRAAVEQLGLVESAVRIDAPDEPVMVAADEHRLGQVLTNLLTNAVKYSPEGADITVRISHDETSARVAVIDRGPGIPPEDLPNLFQRFYRATGTAGHVQGLGLGLYISHRIVAAHGGQIDVESEPGHGSTFTVTLPIINLHRG